MRGLRPVAQALRTEVYPDLDVEGNEMGVCLDLLRPLGLREPEENEADELLLAIDVADAFESDRCLKVELQALGLVAGSCEPAPSNARVGS